MRPPLKGDPGHCVTPPQGLKNCPGRGPDTPRQQGWRPASQGYRRLAWVPAVLSSSQTLGRVSSHRDRDWKPHTEDVNDDAGLSSERLTERDPRQPVATSRGCPRLIWSDGLSSLTLAVAVLFLAFVVR